MEESSVSTAVRPEPVEGPSFLLTPMPYANEEKGFDELSPNGFGWNSLFRVSGCTSTRFR